MGKEALERNKKRYGKKLSEDQIYELTANQANAAFGELNYKWLGRNPTIQDILRLSFLAPDFLEARARFAGQGAKPYGREQSAALIRGALLMAVPAAIFNMIMNDGEAHLDKPFTAVIGGKQIALRTVPGDIIHLFSNPASFVYWRLNPVTIRTVMEAAYGRDAQGRKRTAKEQFEDFFTTFIPIPLQGLVKDSGRTLWESFAQSIGVNVFKNRSKAEKMISDYNFDKVNLGIQSDAERERGKLRHRAIRDYSKDKTINEELKAAVREKRVAPLEAEGWLKDATIPELVRGFKHLSQEQAAEVWTAATHEEKRLLFPHWVKKTKNQARKFQEGETMVAPVFE
jgi:hypothetical protein